MKKLFIYYFILSYILCACSSTNKSSDNVNSDLANQEEESYKVEYSESERESRAEVAMEMFYRVDMSGFSQSIIDGIKSRIMSKNVTDEDLSMLTELDCAQGESDIDEDQLLDPYIGRYLQSSDEGKILRTLVNTDVISDDVEDCQFLEFDSSGNYHHFRLIWTITSYFSYSSVRKCIFAIDDAYYDDVRETAYFTDAYLAGMIDYDRVNL